MTATHATGIARLRGFFGSYGLAVALGLIAFAIAMRLSERSWLVELLRSVAGEGSDGRWLGFWCSSSWIFLALVTGLVNAVSRRLAGRSVLPVAVALPVFTVLGLLAVVTAPSARYPGDWDRNMDAALPGFFEGWLWGAAALFVFGGPLWARDRYRRWRTSRPRRE